MEFTLSRRELVSGAAAILPAIGTELLAQSKGPTMLPIIDTHQHLWDFKLFHPPWLAGEPKIDKSTTMEDYYKATAGLNVAQTVYMEVDVAPADQMREAKWVEAVSASKQTPMRAAVVSCRPGKPGFEAYAHKIKAMKHVRGMRQVLQVPETPKGYCLQSTFVRDIQLLGQLGLTWDICMRPAELPDAAQLVDDCPEVRFILDHCGNGAARNPDQEQWKRDITDIAKRPNIVCKISGIIKTVPAGADPVVELEAIVRHCLDSFGPNRVMFGGDWPVCNLGSTFAGWVHCLKTIVQASPESDQHKLFHDNALRFYRLSHVG